MSKNKGLKRILAYIMVFAMVCSTSIVSPLFMDEAQAGIILPELDTNVEVEDGMYLISDNIESSLGNKSNLTITKDELVEKITDENNAKVALIDMETWEGYGIRKEKGVMLEPFNKEIYVNPKENQEPSIKDLGEKKDIYTDAYCIGFEDSDTFVLELEDITCTVETKWFKLTDVSKTYTVPINGNGNEIETISVDAFRLSEINSEENGNGSSQSGVTINDDYKLQFNKDYIDDSMYGLYMYVDLSREDIKYHFVNLYKDSNLEAEVVGDKVFVKKEGDTVELKVNASTDEGKELVYNWAFWNEEINNDAPNLKIDSYKPSNAGEYTCKVSDGIASKTITFSVIDNSDRRTLNYRHFVDTFENAILESSIPTDERYRKIWFSDNYDIDDKWEGADVLKVTEVDGQDYGYKNSKVILTQDEVNRGVGNVKCITIHKEIYEQLGYDMQEHRYVTIKDCLENGKTIFNHDKNESISYILSENLNNQTGLYLDSREKLLSKAIYLEEFEWNYDNKNELNHYVKIGEEFNYAGNPLNDLGSCGCVDRGEEGLNINSIKIEDLGVKNSYYIWDKHESCNIHTSDRDIASYHNLIYVSDLNASPVNGEKSVQMGDKNVELKINATSELPLSYRWKKVINTLGKPDYDSYENLNTNTLTIAEIDEDDIYVPNKMSDLGYGYVVKKAYNYYICEVSNGIEKVEIPFVIYKKTNTGSSGSSSGGGSGSGSSSTGGSGGSSSDGGSGSSKPQEEKETETLVIDEIASQIYTGGEIKPSINASIIKKKGSNSTTTPLISGTDYTVEYKNNINVGTASVVITPSSKYKVGAVTKTFTINKADNEIKIADVDVKVGESIQPATTMNTFNAALEYKYYSDVNCTNEISVPTQEGVYYVKAFSKETSNYNAAESNVAVIKITEDKKQEDEKEEDKKEDEGAKEDKKLTVTSKVATVKTKSNEIKFSWSKVEGATGYRVYIAKGGKWEAVANATKATTFTATGLAGGTAYKFAIKAYSIVDGKVIWADKHKTVNLTTAPGITSKIKVARGYTSVKLNWNTVKGATGYRVYMAKGGKWVSVASATKAKTFTQKGLKSGANYKFAVKAYRIENGKVIWADTYKTINASTVKK